VDNRRQQTASATGRKIAHVGEHDEHGRWAAYGPIHRGAPALRWISRNEARRRAKRERRRTESRFQRAPFPLYGLPPWWQGERFLGGGGWGRERGRETIHALSLVHGTLVEGEGPILSVETSVPRQSGGGRPLRVFAEELWTGRASDVADAWARLRHRWAGHPMEVELSPLPTRTKEAVSIEARPVLVDILSQPAHWVGRARIGEWDLTIEGFEFERERLGLVRITDIWPYIAGTRRFEAGNSER
jgi:hypothetical protein